MVTYCTAANVASFIQVATFDGSSKPTLTEVNDLIEMNEDHIDKKTMNAWRSITVTDEYHHIGEKGRAYRRHDGFEIFLDNRNITAMSLGAGDSLKVWNGNTDEEWLDNKVEGRNRDFWFVLVRGILFIKQHAVTLPKFFAVRITYRFGEPVVDKDIKKACILLTAVDLAESDDRSILFPEGTSNVPLPNKIDLWKKEAEEIISTNREIKVL